MRKIPWLRFCVSLIFPETARSSVGLKLRKTVHSPKRGKSAGANWQNVSSPITNNTGQNVRAHFQCAPLLPACKTVAVPSCSCDVNSLCTMGQQRTGKF